MVQPKNCNRSDTYECVHRKTSTWTNMFSQSLAQLDKTAKAKAKGKVTLAQHKVDYMQTLPRGQLKFIKSTCERGNTTMKKT